eukprot:1730961-Pyramimonas_sp.AAC.1
MHVGRVHLEHTELPEVPIRNPDGYDARPLEGNVHSGGRAKRVDHCQTVRSRAQRGDAILKHERSGNEISLDSA